YTFRVVASNAQGSGAPSKEAGPVTPAGMPLAPPNVSATAGNHQATVRWGAANGNGAAVTAYVIKQLPGGKKQVVGGAKRSVVFTGLTNGQEYTFKVPARTSVGTGPASTTDPVTPAGAPTKVRNVSAAPRHKAALVSWAAAKPNGSPILRYQVAASN